MWDAAAAFGVRSSIATSSIPEGTVIGYDVEADRARFSVSENGVVVVVRPESMLEEPE